MFLKKPAALVILFCMVAPWLRAQTTHMPEPAPDGSLQKRLLHTRHDTVRLRLNYRMGEQRQITRISFWDSIRLDAKKHRLVRYQCGALAKLAGICYDRGRVEAAIKHYESGLKIAKANALKSEMIVLIRGLERIYAVQFNRQKTLDLIYEGLKLAEELNDKQATVDFYSALARYHLTSGEIDRALGIHFKMLEVCRKINYPFGIVSSLVGIGNDYAARYQMNKGAFYYLESKKYVGCIRDSVYLMQVYNSVSSALMYLKQYDSAYFYAVKAFDIAQKTGNKRALASALVMLASSNQIKGNHTLAKKQALQALELVKQSGFTAQVPHLSEKLKNIYLREKNYKAALEMFELQVKIRDSLSGEADRKRALEKEFAYDLEKKEQQNRILEQKNQIQGLQLSRNRFLLFGFGALLLFICMVAWVLFRHNRLKTQHQRIRLEQKLLRSQMDPHFIFNSLNSIQQLVMNNRNGPAELYLSKFARFIRDMLESSTLESLSLKDEINMLHHYLELEALRFGATFSYTIKTDDRLEADCIQVPPLIIQPFVENALWHGLLARENNRILQLSFEYHTNSTIRCIIDDNGVGRAVAARHKNSFGKKSLGLNFVQQRIDLVNETQKTGGSIQITDKKDSSNNSLGTTVTVILPITSKQC